MKTILTALTIILAGCTAATTPDELSLHGYFGRSDATGHQTDVGTPSSSFVPSSVSTGSDADFWMLGATVTWYIEQPDTPMHRTNTSGHPVK